ncbi:MAG: hypothetical protein AUJ75_02150 [Candidatus Omnitrophica bacterium CG1_02_49_10]|nr:MAG: hypothetical protein AUJ75_02150 [Candidatus Omnitrophica bacterium CG1_02_49_10]
MTAAVLAGGRSSRMGEDKSLLKFGGRYLIEVLVERINPLFKRTFIVTNLPDSFSFLKIDKFNDLVKEPHSSLRGIYSAVELSDSEYTFVFACDMPFVNEKLIKYMISRYKGYDAVIPRSGERHFEPLHAIYAKRCTGHLKRQIGKGELEIKAAFKGLNICGIAPDEIRQFDPDMLSFFNINTKDDYAKAVELTKYGRA